MCATYQLKGKTCKPDEEVVGAGAGGIVRHPWAGFARSEILAWWKGKGAVLVDLPAERFAERSEVTGKLVWDDVPSGLVIRGLVDIQIKMLDRSVAQLRRGRVSAPIDLTPFLKG